MTNAELRRQIKVLYETNANLVKQTEAARQENYDRYQKQLLAEENEKKAKAEVAVLTAQLSIAKQALFRAHAYMATSWALHHPEK